jgi:hypothetical protein
MLTLPITVQSKQQEWKIILTVAQNNGFPAHIIHDLKKKLIIKKQRWYHNNTTKQKMGNIYLSRSPNKKDH